MKRVTIHDANILIDLTNLELIEEFFKLNFEFHTTDLAFDEISKGLQKNETKIFESNLQIKTFTEVELEKIVEIEKKYKTLSIQDVSVLELSIALDGILCTGDRNLKKIAIRRGLEIHGTLWIIKQMFSLEILCSKKTIQKLEKLENINPRIPQRGIRRMKEKLSQS